MWATEKIGKTPLLEDPSIIIIVTGSKIAYVGERQIKYDRDTYLLVSVPFPFECACAATTNDPLLGMIIDIDGSKLYRFANMFDFKSPPISDEPGVLPLGLQPAAVDAELANASERLMNALCSPSDAEALGASIIDEIMYRVLKGEHGPTLLSLTGKSTHFARIAKIVSQINESPAQPVVIADLAASAGMSIRNFHRSFKEVTCRTPLQYVKIARLNKAMELLRGTSLDVGAVAREVGYESSSQFSREFKYHFGIPAAEVKAQRHS